jgi:hypothetical protein
MINCSETITYDAMLAAAENYSIAGCDFGHLLNK